MNNTTTDTVQPDLHVYKIATSRVVVTAVASSAEDALTVAVEEKLLRDDDRTQATVEQIRDTSELTLADMYDSQKLREETKTCLVWARETGRGVLCVTD